MQNLANFGVLPLVIDRVADYRQMQRGDQLRLHDVRKALSRGQAPAVENATNGHRIDVHCELSQRQLGMVLAGGLLNWMRARFKTAAEVLTPEPRSRPGASLQAG
jgi:aconitate hydratase